MKLLNDFSNRFKDRTIVPLYYKKISPPPCGRIAVYGGVAILQAMEGGGADYSKSLYAAPPRYYLFSYLSSYLFHILLFIIYSFNY